MNEFQKNLPKRLCLHCNQCGGNLPENAFSHIPENCGYSGFIFLKQEEHKQKVRKLDEEITALKVKIKNAKGNAKKKKYEQALEKVNNNLKKLKEFGPIDF
ncbi:MAG: hypothetical protein ACI37S_06550 [Candidatus Gastranaerophilaceae bacterium]